MVENLTDLLNRVIIAEDVPDSWMWQNAAGHAYTVAEGYKQIVKELAGTQGTTVTWSELLWIRWTPQRLNFFVWRVLLDRIATLPNLQRRRILGEEESVACRLCNTQEDESVLHLFFNCNFAKTVWIRVFSWLDLQPFAAGSGVDWLETFASMSLPKSNRAWLAVFHGTIWLLWKARNELIFTGSAPSANDIFEKLKLNLWLWFKNRGLFRSLTQFCDWERFPSEVLGSG